MSIRFLKLSLASPESIRSWTERILPNGKRVGKILKGDLIDYKNGLPIRDGLSCERIFGPMVSFTCTCGRFKCIETRGIHIVHDTLRSSRPILSDVSRQSGGIKQWGELQSPFQNSSNSTRLEKETIFDPIVSQNKISKPVQKVIDNEKPVGPQLTWGSPNKKLLKSNNIETLESSILQPQKKMIRFLSDFYYDYKSIYHSNQNQIIPSFVSLFQEPQTIPLTTKNFLKPQTAWYHSKKWQMSNSSNLVEKKPWPEAPSSIVQNLLKPLYKFIFQIYTRFWFDLKVYYNNFIYEKHIFLWVPHRKFKTSKICHNTSVYPSFFSKLKIQGLYDKSQNLPIINGVLPRQRVCLSIRNLDNLNQGSSDFLRLACLSMTKSFGTAKFLNKISIYWLQRDEKIELPYIFQFSMKLKLKKTKTKPYLSKDLQIGALYFAVAGLTNIPETVSKPVKINGEAVFEKPIRNTINQKLIGPKKNIFTKNMPNQISLLLQEPVLLNTIWEPFIIDSRPTNYGKNTNILFGSQKMSRFDLKQGDGLEGLSNPFQKLFKKSNRNSQFAASTLFRFYKELSKPISIFDSFKKQEKIRTFFPTSNNQSHSTIPYSFSNYKPVSSLSSSPQMQETFLSNIVPIDLASNNREEISKPYVSSNTKQNIRVYKFKNFPPEEIRYCPYCEVELLPNSIRRYRLGYIEFVSPVTHIWYTANSIPLLLNLSKTMIEGIASCHEALSSGFPPVYKWSYNGESPTSWTFQMQPLKLPINLVPKISSWGRSNLKKLYFTEIILKSNPITCQAPTGVSGGCKQQLFWGGTSNLKVWIPSFQITLTMLSSFHSENDFIIYKKPIKSFFIKNTKTNYKTINNKLKPKELLSVGPHVNKSISPSVNRGGHNMRVPQNNSWFLNPSINTTLENSAFNNNFLSSFKYLKHGRSHVGSIKKHGCLKYLWMFEYPYDKSLPKTSCFAPVSNHILPSISPVVITPSVTEEVITTGAITGGPTNDLKQEPDHVFNPPPAHMSASRVLFLNQKKMAKQFLFICLLKYNYFNYFLSIAKPWLSYNSGIFFPIKLFCEVPRTRSRANHNTKISFSARPWFERTITNRKATALKISNETMRVFSFFNQIQKKANLHSDLYTATESEKKREWLKLEGFFEDFSNQKLPDSSLVNSKLNNNAKEKDSPNQKHLKSWNETEEKNENDSRSFDNLSLPLVLPFLGKNPDNIEFQNNYSNHEHFHIDPLKFIIDLFTTQHIWGYSSFDKLKTNQDSNLEVFTNQKQSNNLSNNAGISYSSPLTSLSNHDMPSILYTNQIFKKKNKALAYNFIKKPYLLKELSWTFSLFSVYQEIGFWPSLNWFYMINDSLFSKTDPFLPSSSTCRFKGLQAALVPSFSNSNKMCETMGSNPKNNSLWYPNQVQNELWSNYSNFTNYRKSYKNDFRKLGRNVYYFQLEQMARLENAFLKNLFYRNKFHKASVFKNGFLILPFISTSIFYSVNYSNKIMMRKTNQSNKMNQDLIVGKKLGFLFGFHLNVYGFNFLRFYLSKNKYLPFFLEKNKFFSYEFPSLIWFTKMATTNYREREKNLKNFFWPLKSNSHKKLYLNNLNVTFYENVENIYRPYSYRFRNFFPKEQKLIIINSKTIPKWQAPSKKKNYFGDLQHNWFPFYGKLKISENTVGGILQPYNTSISFVQTNVGSHVMTPPVIFPSLNEGKITGGEQTRYMGVVAPSIMPSPKPINSFYFLGTQGLSFQDPCFGDHFLNSYNTGTNHYFKYVPLKVFKQNIIVEKQASPFLFWIPNFQWRSQKEKSTPVGVPISLLYDLIIFRSSFLKTRPSLETKRFENKKHWPKTLKVLCIEKYLKEWTQNQKFPAVYFNNLATNKNWLFGHRIHKCIRWPFKNNHKAMVWDFCKHWSTQKTEIKTLPLLPSKRAFRLIALLNFEKRYFFYKRYWFDHVCSYTDFNKQHSCVLRIPNVMTRPVISRPVMTSPVMTPPVNSLTGGEIHKHCLFNKWLALEAPVFFIQKTRPRSCFKVFKARMLVRGASHKQRGRLLKHGCLTGREITWGPTNNLQQSYFKKEIVNNKRIIYSRKHHKNSTFSHILPPLGIIFTHQSNRELKSFYHKKIIHQFSWTRSDFLPHFRKKQNFDTNQIFSNNFLKIWPSVRKVINYQPNQKNSINNKTIKAKQKLGSLALLSFETTQIEFFGSLKIHLKRTFLKVWHHKDQNLKNKIPFWFEPMKFHTNLRDLKSKITDVSNQKNIFQDDHLQHPCFGKPKKTAASFVGPHVMTPPVMIPSFNELNEGIITGGEQTRYMGVVAWAKGASGFFNPFKNILSNFLIGVNKGAKLPTSWMALKKFKNSLDTGFWKTCDLTVQFSLYPNKHKAIVLPWRKLQFPIKKVTVTQENNQRIVKSLSRNNDYFLNLSRLSKLLIEPQTIGNLKHLIMKRHKNMICYAYAIETIQNKKRVADSIIPTSVFEFGSNYSNLIQSLSSKISCFSYFGYSPIVSLNLNSHGDPRTCSRANKLIIQKKSTYQPKILVQTIPKQISLLRSFKQASSFRKSKLTTRLYLKTMFLNVDALEFTLKRPVLNMKNSKKINYIQSNYDLQIKSVNPPTSIKNPDLQIFKWGGRGHIFDRLAYKNNNNYNYKVAVDSPTSILALNDLKQEPGRVFDPSPAHTGAWRDSNQFKNAKHNNTKTTERLLFRTDDSSSLLNWTSEKLNQKMLYYSRPSIDEKQSDQVWKDNTNYYACISQITSWGSDHGSWILFLKYIRANIYKGDQLLPPYFNKMNFQMIPRTGSIMLQQLLSQLKLLPKAANQSLEPTFISKKSISEIDTWQNFVVDPQFKGSASYSHKDHNTTFPVGPRINKLIRGTPKSINKTDQNEITRQYLHYNSSFFSNQAKKITNSNNNLQVTSNRFLSNHKVLINYKTFSILDGLVFLKKNLQRIVQMRLNDTLLKNQKQELANLKANILKRNTSYTNKYALYAYKIKKPVSHKRFRKIYQLNPSKPINNWYRLNNFFSYSRTFVLKNALKTKKLKNGKKQNYITNLLDPTVGLQTRSRDLTNFDTTTNQMTVSPGKNKTHYFHLKSSMPCYIPLVSYDIRILKLIYSLIVSFQLQFMPTNRRAVGILGLGTPQQFNNRYLDNKKLFNGSFRTTAPIFLNKFKNTESNSDIKFKTKNHESKPLRSLPSKTSQDFNGLDSASKVSSKVINWYPTYKTSNTYYHIHSVGPPSTVNNRTTFDRYYLQNLRWVRSYSAKSKKINRLFNGLKNNKTVACNLPFLGLIIKSKNSFQATPRHNSNNEISRSYYNQNYSENFYFSNQKIRIYNVLISPLEVTTSRFFGFPTVGRTSSRDLTAFDFIGRSSTFNRKQIKSESNRYSLKLSQNYQKSFLKTQKWSYIKPVNRLISDIKSYHYAVSNFDFNQSNALKISSPKNKFTNNKYQNPLKTGFRSVLPMNLESYEGQIKSETLFIKLKEIGNYNALIKKKNTLFKTLILKMNSSLGPLLSVGTKVEPLSRSFNPQFNYDASSLKNINKVSTISNLDKNQIQFKNTIVNPSKISKRWNQDFIFDPPPAHMFGQSDKAKQDNSFSQAPPIISDSYKQHLIGASGCAKQWGGTQKKFQIHSPTTGLEFFRTWLFLDSVHCSHLHWFNNRQNKHKTDWSFLKESVLYPTHNSNQTDFPKILQLYKYRKNFLLKKIFKQRVGLTQYSVREPSSICIQNFQHNKALTIGFEAYTLLKRRINTFYDEEHDLNIKYQFQPFGLQIKHSSSYRHWKNLKSFKPQIFDLRNTSIESFKNQIRFRLLTIPQIFDLKDQNNPLNIIRKNEIPINILGPLFFSSSIKPFKKKVAFSVLKVPKRQTFWGTYTTFGHDFKKFSDSSVGVKNFYDPTLNSKKFGFNENITPKPNVLDLEQVRRSPINNSFITVFDEKFEHDPTYTEPFLNPNRPLSSESLFREENLKVLSSYKALLQKAKILEDYPVPDPDPINSTSTCLTVLNGGLPHPLWCNLQATLLGNKLPLFGASSFYYGKIETQSYFYKNKNVEADRVNWDKSKDNTKTYQSLSQFIWDGNQNRFKTLMDSQNHLGSFSRTHNQIKTGQNVFSMRDRTKFEHQKTANTNNISRLSENEQNDGKNTISEPKLKSSPFFSNISLTGQSLTLNTFRLPSESDRFGNFKSSNRTSTLNYGRNLRKLRLQYLRNFRRLRFIEYLKATYIKPEWMILSLLPVLPPDLRPVIANPRGYITGDINTHYQNVIYRNNNIEKLLDTFWIPRKFYSKISFSNHQKASALMLSSIKSYFHSADYLPVYRKKPHQNSISKLFSKLAWFPLTFSYENKIQKSKASLKDNESLISLPEICLSTVGLPSSRIIKTRMFERKAFSASMFFNPFKNTETKLFDWNIERMISPMFFKFTTSYFDFDLSTLPFYRLYPNKIVNPYNNKPLSKDKFFKPWISLRQVKGFFEPKIQETIESKIQNPHKAKIFNKKPWQENFLGVPRSLIEGQTQNFSCWSSKHSLTNKERDHVRHTLKHECFEGSQTMTDSFVPKKGLGFKLDTKNQFYDFDQWVITKNFEESKIKKPAYLDLDESRPYNIHHKSSQATALLKLYNHKSFFGSNIGIATGYNEIVQALNFKAFHHGSAFDKKAVLSENPVPVLEAKIIRTQALHDSKPLQEMQYSLQKAVDALIDNSQKLQSNVLLRKGRPLKSLSDNLKGKEGRFRQHLLGKRVDYSGRSVIVVGPDLKLYECGIPLIMALRLFQPFLILYLIYRFKIASLLATQLIQRKHPMVINLLKKFIETWPILLNRAPTLHRMNIQAFKIRLVQGKAILLHPLVCSSYNADFDGDQMGVHVPITQQARAESWKLLWSINNSIGIASRQPLFLPSQDMVIGNYYLTAPPIDNNLTFGPQGRELKASSPVSLMLKKPWPINMNHYFFSLEEAYQYYLNTAYRFHVNTPVWFRFCMVFETSEREKPIEITLDQYGNSIYTAKYYEKQLKRNRILGKNAFSFTTHSNSALTKHISKPKSIKPQILESSMERLVVNEKLHSFSHIDKTIVLPFQTIFNRNLCPLLLNQIIRSTFGRIEFYYEAFYASRLGFTNNG